MGGGVLIRLATEDEAISILSEEKTVRRINKVPEHVVYQPWMAEQEGHRMLFFFWSTHGLVFDVHIASPECSIIKCRSLAKEIMDWVFSMGATKITTNCPEGKIANMARKMGMTAYKTEGDIIHFEAASCL